MTSRRDTYVDFHVFGASAPEWRQRYVQLSPGLMRSTLVEARYDGLNVFRKSMSERVVQEGCLPKGQICFVLPYCGSGEPPWMQGREVAREDVFVLRGGQDFRIHRPGNTLVVAASFDEAVFERLVDAASWPRQARAMLSAAAVKGAASRVMRLRRALDALIDHVPGRNGPDDAVAQAVRSLGSLLSESIGQRAPSRSAASAASLVARCHQLTATQADNPPSVEELCRRLDLSRRTLQNGFDRVARVSPTTYLRNVRLHAVRSTLLADDAARSSVTDVALANGFTHLGHFASRYRALFGELPSQTRSSKRRSIDGA